MNAMNHPQESRRHLLEVAFRAHFGGEPEIWCRAPGRVDLMGSHTDYNQGWVLTVPISRETWVAARPRCDGLVRLHSLNLKAESSFTLADFVHDGQQRWSNYVRGVARVLLDEGLPLVGFDGVVHTTLPMSSGLSSSAALTCVVATAFEAMSDWQLEPVRKALLCQRAENEFVGVPCGILDQYTSCVGHAGSALKLDCRHLTSQSVAIPEGLSVVIADTLSRRELAASDYSRRRAQCEDGAQRMGVPALRDLDGAAMKRWEPDLPPEVAKRCRFIVEENARVQALAQALSEDDRGQMAQLAADSFRGACELFEIGAPSMHAMREALCAGVGLVSARQAGAGFGGCLVALVETAQVETFLPQALAAYRKRTGAFADIFAVEPAAGAGVCLELG